MDIIKKVLFSIFFLALSFALVDISFASLEANDSKLAVNGKGKTIEVFFVAAVARIIAERRIVDRDDAAEFMSFRERIFVSFGYIGDDERFAPPLGMGRLQSGWKIHIAVSQDNVEAAWDIVKDILIDERIAEVKVVRPGVVFDEFERGKQITIYQFCKS